ncbi:MAG: hypothetical protein H7Y06_13030, partial [Opitutaceae bacterium]|nr:hypothetical protein [Opitutaceae bacterium]
MKLADIVKLGQFFARANLNNPAARAVLDTKSYVDRLPWPKACDVWWFGTSQEWGYSLALGRYAEADRTPNIAAAIDPGAARTVRNIAVPGSNMHVNPYADPVAAPNMYHSHFNAFGNVPSNATGVFVLPGGWNDFGNNAANSAVHATPEWRAFYRWAVETTVMRALMDECQGASIYGVPKTGSLPAITGWATDIAVNNVAFPTLPVGPYSFGFNYREVPGDNGLLAYNPVLSAGNYIEWTAPGEVSDVAVFFNSGQSSGSPPAGITTGGVATIKVNGVIKATITTGYPHNDLSFGAPIWAIGKFLRNVPAGANVRIDGVSGNVAYQFNGFIKPSNDLLRKKIVILS